MTRPHRRLRFLALTVVATATAVTAGIAVSYARPIGSAGYGTSAAEPPSESR